MLKKLGKTGVVILAAGKGTRMKSDKLKVMHEISGEPMIGHVLDAVEKYSWDIKPIVVVCDDDDAVQKYLADRADYAIQKDRLGTGHAVLVAEKNLDNKVENILVLYGDMPFIKSKFIENFVETHLNNENILTLATVRVPSFDKEYESFYGFGRVIRDVNGEVKKIVEKKDANPEELEIKELNTSIFCFKTSWLWSHLKELKNNNAQGEYYLTDLLELAVKEKQKVSTVDIETSGSFGVNSKEDLFEAEKLIK